MQRRSPGKPMETAMTTRSTFRTSIYLAAMVAGSVVLLATGGGAQAGSVFRGFHHYPSPIARIPTGPYKPYTPCFNFLHMRCGPITPPR